MPIFSGIPLGCKGRAGCRVLVRKLHGQRTHGDTSTDRKNSMKVGWSWGLDGTDSGQDMVVGFVNKAMNVMQLWAFVNTVMDIMGLWGLQIQYSIGYGDRPLW